LVAEAGLEDDDLDMAPDEFGSVEAEAQRVAAGLAARFGISTEAVDVAISARGGRAELGYAIVFLDADTAKRLAYDLTTASGSGRMLDKDNT
jgi:hypothetical protein